VGADVESDDVRRPLQRRSQYDYLVTGISFPHDTSVSFSYDDASRKVSMADATGTTGWMSVVGRYVPLSGLVVARRDGGGLVWA